MRHLASWLLFAATLLPSPLAAGDPRVASLGVDVRENRAFLSVALADALDERFFERVESGLPTAVVYQFELQADRKRWYDKTLETSELQVVAMYDALEREYLVNYKLSGKLVESRVVRDLDDLALAMTRLDDVPVFELDDVPRRVRLQVRIRALLGSKTLFAVIPSTVSTDWAESEKFRPTNGR